MLRPAPGAGRPDKDERRVCGAACAGAVVGCKTDEQPRKPAQGPVSAVLGSVGVLVFAAFGPVWFAACCVIGMGITPNDSMWEKIATCEQHYRNPQSMEIFCKVQHSEMRCPVPIPGANVHVPSRATGHAAKQEECS